MSIDPDQRYMLKLKAAYYIYEKEYTQTQVADMLGISRVTLSRLMQEAKQEGIVRVEIVDVRNMASNMELEAKLKERFGLLDAKVVNCPSQDKHEISRRLGITGARVFEHFLRSGMKIGCAWGRTLENLVDALTEDKSVHSLEIVTLLGGSGKSFSQIQPNIFAQKLLNKYNGKGYVINAPCFCPTAELKASILEDPHIQDVLSRALNLDLCLIGIGGVPELGGNGLDDEEAIADLLAHGAVGDVCANYFTRGGALCGAEIASRTITINPALLRNVKRVIAVAGGLEKTNSILGALQGRYINMLITDTETAKAALLASDL